MTDPDTPEVQIVDDAARQQIVDVAAELAELPVDEMLSLSLEQIPVVRSIVGAVSVVGSVRDRLFIRKVIRAFAAMARASESDRAEYVDWLRKAGHGNDLGALLLEAIDKATSTERAEQVGRLFAYCAAQQVPWGTFESLVEMLPAPLSVDLEYFLQRSGSSLPMNDESAERLVYLGYYRRRLPPPADWSVGTLEPMEFADETAMGRELGRALRD